MSRLTDRIAKVSATVVGKNLTTEKLEKVSLDLDIGLGEYVKFQELKSLAAVSGLLSETEAQEVYGYLGNTVDHFNRQTVAVKYVLTGMLGELLQRRIQGRL